MDSRELRSQAGFVEHSGAYIIVNAYTYRVGLTQTAEATAEVRFPDDPNTPVGVEVWSIQITAPVRGEESACRRESSCSCSASWGIDSDSDESMKDFDVTVMASSEGVGTLRATFTFSYSEMQR